MEDSLTFRCKSCRLTATLTCERCGLHCCEDCYGAYACCRAAKPRTPTLQGHLFCPALAADVTQQRDLFGVSDPKPAGPRIKDLPGQTYLDTPKEGD